ncbi:DHH family phosphoesterase [Nakamurella lactea]|uniref:DHH family phosphoesterase n=1 Tax=Nakamurella lactea TaxID=459515 RepID=UPI000421913E|nr:DHH family phosphoesterase [Nakamurella lactea]
MIADQRADLTGAARLLGSARSVLLLAHNNPDADSLGSALTLGLALGRRGAEVSVSFDVPGAIPQSLSGLPGVDLVTPAERWLQAGTSGLDLLVSVDAGSAERLGRLASLFDGDVPLLVIDHHASNTYFGQHHLVDPSADATVVLVDALLSELGVPLDADLAALLYAGLATDTGGFRHGSAAAHVLAARLMAAGARPAELLQAITDSHPFGWLGLLSAVLGRAVLDPLALGGRGLVHTCVTLRDSAGLRQEEADSVIDILRTTSEAAAAAVLKQSAADEWQVSLRSRDGVRVGVAAIALGGGGHPQAAGFTWRGDYQGAIAALTQALDGPGAVSDEA